MTTPADEVGIVPDQDADARGRAQIIEKKLLKLIARDTADGGKCLPIEAMPTARSLRRWYRMYYSSGQDVRVLLNHHTNKGNRDARYENWVVKSINEVIDANISVPTPSKFSKALDLACSAIAKERPTEAKLPELASARSGKKLLGKNLIGRWVGKRNRYDLATTQVGIFEARRRFSAVQLGPQGDYPNHQWEVDHTPLDLFVIDEDSKHVHGRPWLTVIMDRYTRCIVGFSLSFAPASWISVGDALRVAVANKTKLIDHVNASLNDKYQIKAPWDCRGIPKFLITDHGREFKSTSMDETLAILNTTPVQTKKRKPWLKGKIERWFRTFQEEFVHTIPGTTFSNFQKRKFYPSEEFAVVTLPEMNWIVLKWVVDIYNQRPHGKIRLSPAEMWRRGIHHVAPRELPPELLRPTMGLVLDRVLTRGGVRFANMRWDSNKFASLRERFKSDTAEVQIRLDPRDLTKIFAWDPGNEKWVEGALIEPAEAGAYSLDQWYYIDTRRKELIETSGLDKREAILQAIADVDAFVKEIAEGLTSSKAYKRYLVNAHRKRSAWEMMLPEDWELGNDGPPGSHDLGGPSPMLVTMQTGPFREPPTPPIPDGAPPAFRSEGAPSAAESRIVKGPDHGSTSAAAPDGDAPSDFGRAKAIRNGTSASSGSTGPAPDQHQNRPEASGAHEDETYRPKDLRGSFKVRKRSETNSSETDE
jgi:putative transposase